MTDFLAVYDYGTGGIWVVMRARSEQDIAAKYPELTVFRDRPSFISDAEYADIKEKMSFDVDEPPRGWLLHLIQERGVSSP